MKNTTELPKPIMNLYRLKFNEKENEIEWERRGFHFNLHEDKDGYYFSDVTGVSVYYKTEWFKSKKEARKVVLHRCLRTIAAIYHDGGSDEKM